MVSRIQINRQWHSFKGAQLQKKMSEKWQLPRGCFFPHMTSLFFHLHRKRSPLSQQQPGTLDCEQLANHKAQGCSQFRAGSGGRARAERASSGWGALVVSTTQMGFLVGIRPQKKMTVLTLWMAMKGPFGNSCSKRSLKRRPINNKKCATATFKTTKFDVNGCLYCDLSALLKHLCDCVCMSI